MFNLFSFTNGITPRGFQVPFQDQFSKRFDYIWGSFSGWPWPLRLPNGLRVQLGSRKLHSGFYYGIQVTAELNESRYLGHRLRQLKFDDVPAEVEHFLRIILLRNIITDGLRLFFFWIYNNIIRRDAKGGTKNIWISQILQIRQVMIVCDSKLNIFTKFQPKSLTIARVIQIRNFDFRKMMRYKKSYDLLSV